ncbi:hypothetical protein RUM43_003814 [Polyplax serrata]|uniref:Uncharacterized protein n=1 Tax=Polyplax serrata TaxID=468196 RepID=A0AAN8RXJ6_POLSC
MESATVKGHYLDKRQIGVLARTGALPQGKRSVEVLARNGELPILRNPKDTRQEETLNSLIKKSQGGETLDATYDREKEVGKLFQNENYGKRFSNDENDEDYNIQVEKKLSEIMSRSGYLIRPAQNGDKESLNLFDPQDLLGNEYRKKRGPYFAMSPEYQTVEESDESHSSSKSDNKENLIEKRFLVKVFDELNYRTHIDHLANNEGYLNSDVPIKKSSLHHPAVDLT